MPGRQPLPRSTTDDALRRTPQGYYRAEGIIRNFNTAEDFKSVDKAAHIERAGRTVWDAINDGTIYSCPSLLCSFSAICYADLKKYKFTYHFAYPCIHSDPQWRLIAPEGRPAEDGIGRLGQKETEELVNNVQTWRYSVDTRQHGFFLAKRLRKEVLEAQWKLGPGSGEIEEEKDDDGNMNFAAQKRRKSRTQSLGELGFLWAVGSLANYENGFFNNAEEEDRFVCFADPSTYPGNPGWMLRNLLVLVRQRWQLDKVQILCYRDSHARREHPTSLVMTLQSATPVYPTQQGRQLGRDMPTMSTSSALRPDDVDAFGELIERKEVPPEPAPEPRVEQPPRVPALPKVTGWERDERNKLVSRVVDLAAYMDPTKLADQAVDLNLRLIKWRISPAIDLETIKHTSCLLLGAGTLGSYVARGLMAWGVRKITFVDNARVSYSNPVRQPLYAFKDCEKGGVRKAERAAAVLREIYPGCQSDGVCLSVPMAGHTVLDEDKSRKDFERLQSLVESHDAIFLLMDTRESRWLPTVMGKAAGKTVINAALGFDTYVVMRHGVRSPKPRHEGEKQDGSPKHAEGIPEALKVAASDPIESRHSSASSVNAPASSQESAEEELGCYFCTDVVAPADSLKNATLDRQCTVTRPGAAPLASALAVELLVSITQHRLRARAPAPDPPLHAGFNQILPAPPTDPSQPNAHPLGTVPHQLRGYMSTWQTVQVKGRAYEFCAACSEKVVQRYGEEGWEFVKRACGEKGFVEEVSGLAEVQRKAEEAERLMMEDEEEDGEWGEEEEEEEEGEMV